MDPRPKHIRILSSNVSKVDSAASYRNDAPCGKAIRESGIPREDIFFTSKIPTRKLRYEKTKAQVDATLKETGLGYIDLMLIHAPYGAERLAKAPGRLWWKPKSKVRSAV